MAHPLQSLPLQTVLLPRGLLDLAGGTHLLQVIVEPRLTADTLPDAILNGLRLSRVLAPPGYQGKRAILPQRINLSACDLGSPAPLFAVRNLVTQPSHFRGPREAPFGLHEQTWAIEIAQRLGLDPYPGGADAIAAAARHCAHNRESLVLIVLARACDLRRFNAACTLPWPRPPAPQAPQAPIQPTAG